MHDHTLNLMQRVEHHLQTIYGDYLKHLDVSALAGELLTTMHLHEDSHHPAAHKSLWDQQDVVMISYGDSLLSDDEKPLHTLHRFLNHHLREVVSGVHILPFFPWSSDDGFAVMNFNAVNEALGEWSDIEAIAADYRLMADLVINHCSSRSLWFENFKKDLDPGKDFFKTASADDDLSQVVRPRTSPLLRETETENGMRHVWCTFSHDQVDFDFGNPKVLIAFADIIRQYLDHGIRIFRLDAVAFLWKQVGTSCINLDQTHEIVRLLRTLIEHAVPEAIIITETNIPSRENLAYFGNANEAHAIYNFSLPPLLLNTLVTGSSHHLRHWLMSMPPAQEGTTFFNFIASHDGIGLRPAEGLLSEEEIHELINTMRRFGGRITWRAGNDGQNNPYEINIALFDALQGTVNGPDQFGVERFICAHAIMLALEGIPAFYIHSLLATSNDYDRLANTSHNRSINRHQWDCEELEQALLDQQSQHSRVFSQLRNLIQIRRQQPALHPNATQFTLQVGDQMFGFWRQSRDRSQSIFCICNISMESQELLLSDINLIVTDQWHDLISGEQFGSCDQMVTLAPYQVLWISNR